MNRSMPQPATMKTPTGGTGTTNVSKARMKSSRDRDEGWGGQGRNWGTTYGRG